jgi:hypothetical protein
MYEEVREFCHQWNNEEQPVLSADQPPLLPPLGGAVRNLTSSLELVDYLPPLTIEELTSLHSPDTDPLLYSDDQQLQQQQQQLVTADSWTDCLQLSPDLPDWMETDTLQFPSLFSLG